MADLPDIYETRQGRAMQEAFDVGDTAAAERIAQEVLAESASTPQERERLAEMMRATILYKELLDASDDDAAQAARDRLMAECSPRAIKHAMAASYLQLGLAEGLPANMHAELVQWIDDLGFGEQIRALVAGIEVLPPIAREPKGGLWGGPRPVSSNARGKRIKL